MFHPLFAQIRLLIPVCLGIVFSIIAKELLDQTPPSFEWPLPHA